MWRVIAYTYNGLHDAQKKANAINEKFPDLHADVFAPRGQRAPYFVSLGGRMTRDAATRLMRQARSKGLPRDTFVRNFSD